ncbi:MAG: hypothetical protein M3P30_04745 [Chloroflexota bacterium]|nr:hypothetical protein [Chloroflexota bacterium]
MRTALYWFSRWPWLSAAVSFFVFAAVLPPFTWWVRTPLLLGLTVLALIVLWGIKANIAHRLFLERVIADERSSRQAQVPGASTPGTIRRLVDSLKGQPRVTPAERDAVFAYYRKSLVVALLQDREAERYNRAAMIHVNSMSDPASAAVMVDASRRLSMCATELIRRQSLLLPVPDLALPTYFAAMAWYMRYSEWADALHDSLVAMRSGRQPEMSRLQQLMLAQEQLHKDEEVVTKKLFRRVGLRAGDLQSLATVFQVDPASLDWEP